MTFLSDRALDRLRAGMEEPDLTGTPYRLLEGVSRGGMGLVYTAEDVRLARRVALKVLDLPGADNLEQRLIQEARVLARLEHPGIVPVHDVGRLPDGRPFYTMKFVEGKQLDEHITEVRPSERLRLFLRVCDAAAFAHAHGVLHRDLKPSNIMVGPFGEVLVMDWGLAKILQGEAGMIGPGLPTDGETEAVAGVEPRAAEPSRGAAPTAYGTVLGTPGYMSPEQARGDVERVDQRSDVYSLGAVLKFLVTSSLDGSGWRDGGGIPKAMAAICAKATAAQPELRYASVEELAADVSRYLDGLRVSAYPENVLERARRFLVRYRTAILLIGAYLLMRILLLLMTRH